MNSLILFLLLSCVPLVFTSVYMSTSKVISKMLTNCTTTKDILDMDYNSLDDKAMYIYKNVTLIHIIGNESIKYQLPNAHVGIASSNKYNRNLPMVIYIHGYFGTMLEKRKYNSKIVADANFFFMDVGAFFEDVYYKSSTNARLLGERIGVLLAELHLSGIKNFYLIGHSLGAHASGFAGKTFEMLTSLKLDRITGLDPAGPCFFNESSNQRLTSSDAKFVDIIHTNLNVFGIGKSIGHVNFYPNGGQTMTGCWDPVCDHAKSHQYFSESIWNDNFLAVRCKDWNTFKNGYCTNNPKVLMGYRTPTNILYGNYYLITGPIYDHALGENGII